MKLILFEEPNAIDLALSEDPDPDSWRVDPETYDAIYTFYSDEAQAFLREAGKLIELEDKNLDEETKGAFRALGEFKNRIELSKRRRGFEKNRVLFHVLNGNFYRYEITGSGIDPGAELTILEYPPEEINKLINHYLSGGWFRRLVRISRFNW